MRLLTLLVTVSALAFVPAAFAKAKPRPGSSSAAVLQYVEVLPTAGGSTAPGVGSKSESRLTPAAAAALRSAGGTDAARLKSIATSSDFGAPATAATKSRGGGSSGTQTPQATTASQPTVSDTTGSGRGWWLVVMLIVIVGVGVVVSLARMRRGDRAYGNA